MDAAFRPGDGRMSQVDNELHAEFGGSHPNGRRVEKVQPIKFPLNHAISDNYRSTLSFLS